MLSKCKYAIYIPVIYLSTYPPLKCEIREWPFFFQLVLQNLNFKIWCLRSGGSLVWEHAKIKTSKTCWNTGAGGGQGGGSGELPDNLHQVMSRLDSVQSFCISSLPFFFFFSDNACNDISYPTYSELPFLNSCRIPDLAVCNIHRQKKGMSLLLKEGLFKEGKCCSGPHPYPAPRHPSMFHWPELWHMPVFPPIISKSNESLSQATKQSTVASLEQERIVF